MRHVITVSLAVTAMVTIARSAGAQTADTASKPSTPWYVPVAHYGRWPALGVAAGLIAVAIHAHDQAASEFSDLLQLCHATPDQCRLASDGTYINASMEQRFQATLHDDRRASRWILAGQAALLAAGGMFVLDLLAYDREPKNIPYTPIQVVPTPGRLEFRVPF